MGSVCPKMLERESSLAIRLSSCRRSPLNHQNLVFVFVFVFVFVIGNQTLVLQKVTSHQLHCTMSITTLVVVDVNIGIMITKTIILIFIITIKNIIILGRCL